MKLVLVSDLHIHPWQEHNVQTKNGPSRLLDCVNVLYDVLHHCRTRDINYVIIGGDVFHKRGVVYTQAYNLAVEALAEFKRDGRAVLTVDGNHDHANKTGTVHSVQALASAKLVNSIDEETGWVNWSLGDGEVIVSGYSYCDDRELFEQRLHRSSKNYEKHYQGVSRIAVCHHGFKGARVGTALEYVVREDIDPDLMSSGFDYIFSGHYHTRQRIGKLDNAIYIGSPLENTRGEGETEKGFLEYDTERRKWKLIPLKRPRFVTLTQELIDEKDYTIVEENFVDVAYNTLPCDPDKFKARLFKRYGASGVKLAPLPRKRASNDAGKRLDVDLTTDDRTLLARYIKHANVTGKKHRKALLARGLDLLDKAQK